MIKLTENIRNRRRELGLTQRELAEKLGISDKTVSRWESGVQTPDAAIIPDVAKVLGVSIAELYGERQDIHCDSELPDGSDEKIPAMPATSIRAINLYRTACILSMFFLVFGAVLMKLNVSSGLPYTTDFGTVEGYIVGIITTSVGLLMFISAKIIFPLYYRKPERFNYTYLNTDVTLSMAADMVLCVLFLIIAPRLGTFSYNIIYVGGCYIAAALLNLDLLLMKRELRKRCEKVSTVIFVISWSLFALSIIAFFICADTGVLSLYDSFLGSYSGSESVAYWLNNLVAEEWRRSDYYVSLLAIALPLISMLLINSIELKIRAKALLNKYIGEHGKETKHGYKLWQKIIAVVIAIVVLAGSVFFTLIISKVIKEKHYIKLLAITDSMKPEFSSGDLLLIDTDYDPDDIEKGDIIAYYGDISESMDGAHPDSSGTLNSSNNILVSRVIAIEMLRDIRVFQTKGDNNYAPDSGWIQPQDIIGVYAGVSDEG